MQTQVAIVGGGPVGLGLAIDLAQRGVCTHVIERSTTLHSIPKGQNLTQRTGEHFRAWGITEAVRAASPIPASFGNAGMVAWGQLLSDYTYDWFKRGAVGQYYFARNERLPQYCLEAVLRQRAAAFGAITFEQGVKATGVTQTDDQATVEFVRQDGTTGQVSAPFVVGCDGSRSVIRQAAGIGLQTDHTGPRMALLVFRSQALHDILERYPGKSIFNVMNPDLDGYWQFLGRVDLNGGWFYHAPMPEGTTAGNFDFRAHLHQAVGTEFPLEFEYIGFWDLRISMAERYRNGRVFIAGDAAHSHPPYGGYGINTGFEDARNLSWKLAGALNGWAGAGLLDSYSAERLPVFASTSRDFIARMIHDDRAFAAAHDPARDLADFQRAWAERATAGNADVTEFLPNYAGSPIVFGPRGATSGARGSHGFAARAGFHLAPQPLGDDRGLWGELGPGFTLIDLGEQGTAGKAFSAAASALGVPLTVVQSHSAAAREAWGAEVILIRPDLFVAWAGSGADCDARAILSRATGI